MRYPGQNGTASFLQQVDLTFDKALETALAAEAGDKDSRRLMPTTSDKDLPTLTGKTNDLPVHNLSAGVYTEHPPSTNKTAT